jgi:hypothetical protein
MFICFLSTDLNSFCSNYHHHHHLHATTIKITSHKSSNLQSLQHYFSLCAKIWNPSWDTIILHVIIGLHFEETCASVIRVVSSQTFTVEVFTCRTFKISSVDNGSTHSGTSVWVLASDNTHSTHRNQATENSDKQNSRRVWLSALTVNKKKVSCPCA